MQQCLAWLTAQQCVDDDARTAFLQLGTAAMWEVARQGPVQRSKQLIGRITALANSNPNWNTGSGGEMWGRPRNSKRPCSDAT